MNKVILVGRLVKDPELKRTNSDIPVVQFSIAVNRTYSSANGEKQTDFINCVVFRQQAENLARYMRKGYQIGVEGRLQTRTYEDQGGVKRYSMDVMVDQIHFLESKNSRVSGGYNDVNTFDIPQETSNPFATTGDSFSKDNANDPFASLKTSSEISDDDLPF